MTIEVPVTASRSTTASRFGLVTKGYRKSYQIESGAVELSGGEIWEAKDG